MAVFSPLPLKNVFFFNLFVKVTPQEESKCKNAEFLQWIQRMMMSTFKKLQNLKFGEFFHSEKYRVFAQYAAATILRHWATMS